MVGGIWSGDGRSIVLNRRAIATLEQLTKRYENDRKIPSLNEVEDALWRAGDVTNRPLQGFWRWPRGRGWGSSDIENWTLNNLGRSFPCAEAAGLIGRYLDWSSGRIIDIGAGFGLWTKVLKRRFGSEKVIGLDPEHNNECVIETTFRDWCENTGGLRDGDVALASWLPCSSQLGADLGLQILDCIQAGQTLVYIGSGPRGPTGTKEFYDRLGREFEEHSTEPLPRICRSIFPRDFARAYHRKV